MLSKVTKPLTKTAAGMPALVAKIEFVIMNSNQMHEIMAGRKKEAKIF